MNKILPVFLALCLGIAPVFSQDARASAAANIAETESLETAQFEADYLEAAPLFSSEPKAGAPAAAVMGETALYGNDVPQFSLLRAFGSMGLILCLLVGAYFGIRKYAPGYFPKMSPEGKNLKIVESLGMGDRRSIALVEVGGKRFLIGSTPQQINLLTSLPEQFSFEENEVKAANVVKVREEGEKQAFRNMFEMGKKHAAKNSGNVIPDEVRQKMRRLREALENR
jgi:flagellar biosynthetic protein FliO